MTANVVEWLDKTAVKYPDKRAIWDEEGGVTFSEYRNKAMAIAREIINLSIEKKPVVVYFKKSAKVLVSFAAAAYSGNFYSPIDVDMPVSRVSKIVEVLEPAVVVTSAELKGRFDELGYKGKYIIYEDVEIKEDDEQIVAPVRDAVIDTDILYVLFTSGSTGMPKGVAINHRAIMDYTEWHEETFKVDEKDIIGNQAPFYFDVSHADIYTMMKTGAELVIVPKVLFGQPGLLLNFINEHQINSIFWVPSAMMIISRLKAFKKVDISKTLKKILFAGEVMPAKQLNIWKEYVPDAIYANLYGPTEATVSCTFHILTREFKDDDSIPIGIPMKNTGIIVLDDKDNLVETTNTETVGELCVKGTGVAVGYYANPEKTKEVFIQNPLNKVLEEKIYRTGDLVKYNEYGEIIYIGRKDFQIKHLGHRIELGEIETAYSSIDDAPNGCCIYDEKRSKIVLITEGEVNKEEIAEKLTKMVPEYMLPNKYIAIDVMPLNDNGKIDRKKLKEML